MTKSIRRYAIVLGVALLTLAIAGTALAAGTGINGFAASDYITGLSSSSIGPIGVAFDGSGNLYVADWGGGGTLEVFPPGGGSTPTASYAGVGEFGLAFGPDGNLYATTFSSVIQVDPATGAAVRTVAMPPSGQVYGIAVDPLTGDLFVSTDGSTSTSVYRISNYTSGPGTVTPYTGNIGAVDGISFGPDGALYAAANGSSIEQVAGTNAATPGVVLTTASISGGPDGVVVAADNSFIVSNNNNGTMTKIVFSGATATTTTIVTGGTRGDFATAGPDGCLYATQSTSIVKVTASDGTCPFLPVAPNPAPTADAGGPYAGIEGSAIAISGTASDTDGDTVTTHWSYTANTGTDGTCVFADPSALDTTVTCTDQGSYTLTLSADDGVNDAVTSTTDLTVNNAPIAVDAITGLPSDPIAVNTSVTASATFTDPGTADSHTATWDWGDGSTSAGTVSETAGSGTGSVTDSHTYTAAGVYAVTLTVSDQDDPAGMGTTTYQYVVVYDASAGFVTGGGWINSPAGACTLTADCATATGKANFGFVSKYKKGASVPTGNTEFQFQAGNLDFHSSSYQWLVINQGGTNAQYKGTGTINGAGSYTFMIWAGDGTPDTFRIQITDNNNGGATVYDNGVQQAIGGGSIVIHSN